MRRILTIGTLVLSVMGGSAVFAQAPSGEGQTQQGQMQPEGTPEGQQQGQMGQMRETGKTEGKLSVKDKKFIERAAEDHLAAIDLGKLAADRASNDQVKSFANMTVDDHTQSLDKLKKIASDENFPVPSTVTTEAKRSHEKLSKLSGDKFDKEYVKVSEKDHKKTVDTFQKASNEVTTPELKSYAQSSLPALKKHGEQLDELKTSTSKGTMEKGEKGMEKGMERGTTPEQQQGTMPEQQQGTMPEQQQQGTMPEQQGAPEQR